MDNLIGALYPLTYKSSKGLNMEGHVKWEEDIILSGNRTFPGFGEITFKDENLNVDFDLIKEIIGLNINEGHELECSFEDGSSYKVGKLRKIYVEVKDQNFKLKGLVNVINSVLTEIYSYADCIFAPGLIEGDPLSEVVIDIQVSLDETEIFQRHLSNFDEVKFI